MTAELKLNGVSLVEDLKDESGLYKTDYGLVGIELNIGTDKDRQEVILNCSRDKRLMGKRIRTKRTMTLGSDGRGSQQISPNDLLEYDLGRSALPKRMRRPIEYYSNTDRSWKLHNVVAEIWDR